MRAQLSRAKDPDVDAGILLFQDLMKGYGPRDFDMRFWDGTLWEAEPGQPARFTLVIHHPSSLQRMFSSPIDVSLGEAYIYGDYDIEGDFEAAFRLADFFMLRDWGVSDWVRLGWRAKELSRRLKTHPQVRLEGPRHSEQRDRHAVTYHYDVSNDFYALWLDPRMVYSCAYFISPGEDLERAQLNKLDLICRKLQLKPGERFLDIGCGWGGLLIYAAQNYGVQATGITLSERQAALAWERIHHAGLSETCQVQVLDYRQLDEPGYYEKVASIGMVEHVGEEMLPRYFDHVHRLLRPGGIFLNQGIARTRFGKASIRSGFSSRYVFPDAETPPIDVTLKHAEQVGFEVRHVEGLREHYAMTLRHWVRNLEAGHTQARKIVEEETYRIWRLYMTGSAYWFKKGDYSVYQTLLAKGEV